jgi:protein O-mannosyl-transferase
VNKRQNVKYYLAFSVALITFAIYVPALQNDFIDNWDDNIYVTENAHIRSIDLKLLQWAFLGFFQGNWHPLTVISHAADYAVWGLNPFGHHLTNIVLHAANTFLVIILLINLLEALQRSAIKKSTLWAFLTERTMFITAGTTGLLFGLHPVHVESVAWIAERKDLLCALFFLLSIITYTTYVQTLRDQSTQKKALPYFLNRHYVLTVVFFILALLSKPMAVTLPVVLLILDWYPFNRMQSVKTFQSALIEKIPFITLSLISSILAILAQGAQGALMPLESVPLSTRILVGAKALVMYLWKMVWPLNLIPLYSYSPKRVSLGSMEYFSAIVLVVACTAASVSLVKKQKLWLAVWGYYVVTLLPVLGIVQVGSQLMADRYTYLPSLGPLLTMGLFAALIAEKVHTIKQRRPIAAVFSVVVALSVLVSLSYLTVKQIVVWKNSITLWSCVIDKQPYPVLFPFKKRVESFHKKGQWSEEIQDYDAIISLDPSDGEAYYNRGVVFHKMGQLDRAKKDYDTAIAKQPFSPEAYNNRGVVYITLGLFDKAIEDLNHSIAINPQRADVHNSRGFAYLSIHQYEKALKDFNTAVNVDSNYVMAYLNRGKLYLRTGQTGLARADFKKACDLGDKDACSALR